MSKESKPFKLSKTRQNIGIGLLALIVVLLAVAQFRPSAPAVTPEMVAEGRAANDKLQTERKAKAQAIEDAKVYVAFLGDSFTVGTGSTNLENDRWSAVLSDERGWIEKNFGAGGTNYATGSQQTGGTAYTERVPDVIKADPDIVIVSGGGNSLDDDQSEGITEVFTELRKGLPDARIIALSPFWRAEPFPANLDIISAQIDAGVTAIDGEYVDLGHPMRKHPELFASDGVHPNTKGYAFLADAVDASLHQELKDATTGK